MSKVRGIRFSAEEDALIEEFLLANSFFDFSTLAKVAILEFIHKPQISLKAVGRSSKKGEPNVRSRN